MPPCPAARRFFSSASFSRSIVVMPGLTAPHLFTLTGWRARSEDVPQVYLRDITVRRWPAV
jgi:hypothetical protein